LIGFLQRSKLVENYYPLMIYPNQLVIGYNYFIDREFTEVIIFADQSFGYDHFI